MKPTLIGKSEKPRALKDADMKRIPVHYRAPKSSWMTSQLFTDLLQWFDTEVGKKEQNRKVLLFMDNASVHNSAADNVLLKHTKVVFFPKSTTSYTQPLDAGVIQTFKLLYKKASTITCL
ncbi:Tigger transposable element-derived protein 6-like [Oopsacas minuta]|uniref:Tigger transposable element-derived protein 6-like n=1 Tax=Oopsacas minuta TaxID=111878 RepID=A0AAV7JQN5_9METZ|nr:Tigger transposable element-derived protein 6-like [Oopsacas minuta]